MTRHYVTYIFVLLSCMSVMAQTTKANTRIVNQAVATYMYEGTQYNAETNLVLTTVSPIYGVVVMPDGSVANPGQMIKALVGSEVTIPYQLVSTANDVDSFELQVIIDSNSTFLPSHVYMIWDQNSNGRADTNEPRINRLSNVLPQEIKDILVCMGIPIHASIGSYAYPNIQATSVTDASVTDHNNYSRVDVVSGPLLDIKITHFPKLVYPDELIQYNITGSNIGYDLARPVPLQLDGSTGAGVIIRTKIPEAATNGTVYVPNSGTSSHGQVIYSTDGGITWHSILPPNQTVTDIAVLFIDGLTPDQNFDLTFQVRVHPEHAPGILQDQASATFSDSSNTNIETKSNIITVTIQNALEYHTLIGSIQDGYNAIDPETGSNNDDFQVMDQVFAGNKILFKFQAWNGSTSPQTLNFYTAAIPEGWGYQFFHLDGMIPLLDTDENGLVDIGIVPSKGICELALELRIPANYEGNGPVKPEIFVGLSDSILAKAKSNQNVNNRTFVHIKRILPLSSTWTLNKSSNAQQVARPGEKITYTLAFAQLTPNMVFNHVMIGDVIPKQLTGLEFAPNIVIVDENGSGQSVIATAAYDTTSRVLTWIIPTINGLFRGRVTFSAFIQEEAITGDVIDNEFSIRSSNNLLPIISNKVSSQIVQMDLNVEKTVNKQETTIGDILVYTLKATNVYSSNGNIHHFKFYDDLPLGFVYQKDSTTYNGKKVNDPEISSNGRRLTFNVGTIDSGNDFSVQFMVRVGPGSKMGDNPNIGWATGILPNGIQLSSLPARVSTNVQEGVFAERGWVFGRVYIDMDTDQRYDCEKDIPIPGVRLYLETGQYAISDREGKYTVDDLRLGTHVISLDSITLPAYMKPEDHGRHSAKNGKTQFVDLKLPGPWRSDFILKMEDNKYIPCKTLLRVKLEQHENATLLSGDPVEKEIRRILLLSVDVDQVSHVDKMALQYTLDQISRQGKVSLEMYVTLPTSNEMPQKDRKHPVQMTPEDIKTIVTPKLQAIIEFLQKRLGLTKETLLVQYTDGTEIPAQNSIKEKKLASKTKGILSPEDGSVYMVENAIRVKVAGVLSQRLTLYANGIEVSQDRIGSRNFNMVTSVTDFEYVGVPLVMGENTIELVAKNAKGQEEREKIKVYKARPPHKIIAKTLPNQIPADGIMEPIIVVELLDEEDKLATSGLFVNVTLENGDMITPDAQPEQLGHQLYVKDGKVECVLGASNEVKDCKLTVEIAGLKQEFKISYLPYLRDWIIVGIGEMTAGLENWTDKTDKDEGLQVNGRVAFFARGKILGKFLLTAQYDSQLPSSDKETLLKKVDPDAYYPVYGDQSQQGHEIQSSGRLYVKIEQDRSYILYGDYQTNVDGLLTAYNRTFRGFKGEIETKYLEVKAFGTQVKQAQVKDEIRGQGISGYYFLSHDNIIENTIQIVIEMRDRFQNANVLKSTPKSLYVDYDVNFKRGYILFDRPVLSADENGNPIYIVATYETKDALSKEYIVGAQASVKFLDEHVKIGGTYIFEGQQKGHTTIQGLHAEVKPQEHISIKGEVARSHTYDTAEKATKRGEGYAIEASADLSELQAKVGYQKLSKNFHNPSVSGVAEGSNRFWAEADIKISDDTKAKFKANHTETQSRRIQGIGIRAESKIKDVSTMGGYEFVEETTDQGRKRAHVLSTGIRWNASEHWAFRLERHQIIPGTRVINSEPAMDGTFTKASSNVKEDFITGNNGFNIDSIGDRIVSRTVLGAEYMPMDWLRIWTSQELEDDSKWELSRTLFGFNIQFTKNVDVYSSYGIENGIGSTRNQALIGIRTNIPINVWLSGDIFLERVQTFDNDYRNQEDFTSYGFGLRMNRLEEQGSIRIEFRHTDDGTQFLGTPSLTWKMSQDTTLLWRTRHFQNGKLGRFQHQTVLGFAYRPECSDSINTIAKIQLDWDRDMKRVEKWDDIMLSSSLDLHMRPWNSWDFMLRYATKYNMVRLGNSTSDSFMDLVVGRAIYEWDERFDIGVHGGILHDYKSQRFQYAYGLEAGVKIVKNLWLSVGYNIKGFSDNKMAGNDFLQEGIYVTMRFKFDESTAEELLPAW